MKLTHIVAAAENGTIGVDGALPWDIPEDMKFFRDTTKGKALIMGRKTFESVGHPLPQRLNVVVTRQPNYKAEGAVVVTSIEEAIDICKKNLDKYGDEVFIIGGGEIYRQSMNLVDRIYLTRIHKVFSGDAKYPEVDEKLFKLVNKSDRSEPLPFTFLTYERISTR
ncbi:MAG: dihydrofolate reductase [Bdellovibrionales bacterium]|nr:dihydrofolate reductase [Bdellovibrionales bacterium]